MYSGSPVAAQRVWIVRKLLLAICAAMSLASGLVYGAGPVAGAGSITFRGGNDAVTHGWVVSSEAGERSTVLHLPPRIGRDGAVSGSARLAMNLRTTPVACAARGNRCYLAFEDGPRGFPLAKGRAVLSMAAVTSTGEVWTTHPAGRLDAEPSLRGDGRLLGIAGVEEGLCALLHGLTEDDADPVALNLQVLVGSQWHEVALPQELQAAARAFTIGSGGKRTLTAECRLFAAPDGVGIVLAPPAGAGGGPAEKPLCFVGTLTTGAERGVAANWERVKFDTAGAPALIGPFSVLVCGEHLVATAMGEDSSLTVSTRPYRADGGAEVWREVARVPGVPSEHVALPMDGPGLLAVLWEDAPPGPGPARRMLAEVSVRTGRVMYVGEAILGSPISSADWRLVVVVLTYAVGLVLVFVLKVPPQDVLILPPDVSLAEPMRRMLAGIIDFLLAMLLASNIWDVPLARMLSTESWWTSSAQPVLLTAVGILIASGGVLEAIFGRSVGKLVTGCAVVRMVTGKDKEAEPQPPGFGASLLRNFVKWGLPPVALLGLLDHSSRHRGDVLANAVVVIGAEEDPARGGGDGRGDEDGPGS